MAAARDRLHRQLQPFVDALRAGGVVACPTETQMGLLADALSEAAVERVRAIKGRPEGEALPLIAPSLEVALSVVREVSAAALALATRHWPGPLTLVLQAQSRLPAGVVKDGKVAVRVPGPSPALDLLTQFGGPLTATSANKSGQPPLADAAALRAAFGDALFGVVPGSSPGAPPSTIVDVTGDQPRVLRQGAVFLDV
jgi:L-threonylcarbamoyladenylate synthase